MKILGIVVAILFLLISAFLSITDMNKSFDVDKQIAEVLGISHGRLQFGAILSLVSALAALAAMVLLFVKRAKAPLAAGAAVAIGLIAWLVYPGFETGPLGGMAPKTQALYAFILAAVGAGGAFLAEKKS